MNDDSRIARLQQTLDALPNGGPDEQWLNDVLSPPSWHDVRALLSRMRKSEAERDAAWRDRDYYRGENAKAIRERDAAVARADAADDWPARESELTEMQAERDAAVARADALEIEAGRRVAALKAEVGRLVGLLDAARALHVQDGAAGDGVGSCVECGLTWPCPTWRALAGSPVPAEPDDHGRDLIETLKGDALGQHADRPRTVTSKTDAVGNLGTAPPTPENQA